MKKIVKLVLALCVLLVFFGCAKKQKEDTSLSDLKARGVFVLGLDDSFPPLGFRSADGEIIGYDIDLAKEVAKRLDVEFKAQSIDWSAKEMELKTGKIDCIWNGFTMTKEREKALSFTKPYLANEQVLVVRNNSGVDTLSDMKGKVLAVQSGSSAQEAVNKNKEFAGSLKEIVLLKDNVTALNDLELGGVDGVVLDSVVANYSIATSKKPLVVLDEVLDTESYGVGFRKGDVLLRDEVQRILEEMQADGTVKAISEKWFGRDISVIGK